MSDVDTLIKKIGQLKDGNYEMDLKIMQYLDFAHQGAVASGNRYKVKGSRHAHQIIPYTQSVDAAIRLIPKNWVLDSIYHTGDEWKCNVAFNMPSINKSYSFVGKTVPLAVIGAALETRKFIG